MYKDNWPKNMSTQVNVIYKELGILKISDLVKVELVKMGYGINKSLLPKGIMNLFEPKISASHYNMHSNTPIVPRHQTSKFNKSFMGKTIITWTEQPQETKVAINVKHCVKMYYRNNR